MAVTRRAPNRDEQRIASDLATVVGKPINEFGEFATNSDDQARTLESIKNLGQPKAHQGEC